MIKELIKGKYKYEFNVWLDYDIVIEKYFNEDWQPTTLPFTTRLPYRLPIPRDTDGNPLEVGKTYVIGGKVLSIDFDNYMVAFKKGNYGNKISFGHLYNSPVTKEYTMGHPKDSEGNVLVIGETYNMYGKLINIEDEYMEFTNGTFHFCQMATTPPVLDWKNQEPWSKYDYCLIYNDDGNRLYNTVPKHSFLLESAITDERFIGYTYEDKATTIYTYSVMPLKAKRAKYVVMEKKND